MMSCNLILYASAQTIKFPNTKLPGKTTKSVLDYKLFNDCIIIFPGYHIFLRITVSNRIEFKWNI